MIKKTSPKQTVFATEPDSAPIVALSKSKVSKEELLKQYRCGDLDSAVLLLLGLSFGVSFKDDVFKDEITGEVAPITRFEAFNDNPKGFVFGDDPVLKAELEDFVLSHKDKIQGEAIHFFRALRLG